jgi:hypothetical protein
MGTKHPDYVLEAIWTLRTARPKPVPHAEIRRRLAAGDAGLSEPHPVPEGTYFDLVRKLRNDRGHEDDYVPESGEVDALDEIARRNIGALSARARTLRETAPESTNDALALAKLTREMQAIKRAMTETKDPARVRGGNAKRDKAATNPESTLERLARSHNPASD